MVLSSKTMVNTLTQSLKSMFRNVLVVMVELVGRDSRGTFYVQVKERYWNEVVAKWGLSSKEPLLTLPSLHQWRLKIYAGSSYKYKVCLVV